VSAVESDVKENTLHERATMIVARLQRDADERVGKRDTVEKRWIDDLSQLHGNYTQKIKDELRDAGKSSLFINETRPKANAMEARLSDMLFPTDDRNWGIGPTPVPELTVQAEHTARAAAEAKAAAVANPDDPQIAERALAADAQRRMVQERLEEAKNRSRAMEEEIDDHLRECRYSAQARLVIRDGVRIGTGVLKGPITGGRTRRTWAREPQSNVYQLKHDVDGQPVFWRVDPWHFFPDDAASMEDCESTFERHLMNKKALRKLARISGFDKDAIRRLLVSEPTKGVPSFLTDLRSITGGDASFLKDTYQVWEYHGPLTTDEMRDLATHLGDQDTLDDLNGDIDPLAELQVIIWFCQGEVLKFGIHPLDSGESLYSVFNLEKDEASLFGFGIPYIMRDPQKSLAASWRTLMDNMGLSSGPQIVINQEVIEPANGKWIMEPRKIWLRKASAPADQKPFEIFNIDSHMGELMSVIELSKRNIDEETALPMLAQGEQGTQVTKTFQGMAILMNSANVVFRRIIKHWDDDVTTTGITRLYDWLMQFSPKEEIKGDYKVDARGTSVLLVREIQSTNMMSFIMNFSGHPLLGKYLKRDGLPGLRRLLQTLMIPADEVLKSETEIQDDEAEAASAPPVPNPEMEKIAQMLNLEQLRGENALELEHAKRETALIQLAATGNMKLEELRTMLDDKRRDRESKERIFAAEAAMEARKPKEAGGSGGYLS
jgi:hypothetical protein